MMRKISRITGLALLLCLVFGGSGCILEDVITDLVAKHTAFLDFEEYHESASWTTPYTLDNYGKELRAALEDIGFTMPPDTLSPDKIKSASLVSARYGVIDIPGTQTHDWRIGGKITVARGATGTPETLIEYTNESVQGLLGTKKVAVLNSNGVDVINQALDELVDNINKGNPYTQDPVLVFAVENGSVSAVPGAGPPTPADPLEFDWRAWITMEIVVTTTISDVPDPWGG